MNKRVNCWEAFHQEGGRRIKKGDTLVANDSEFGLYEDRPYTVIETFGTDVQVEIFPGKPEWYTIEFFDFPEDAA